MVRLPRFLCVMIMGYPCTRSCKLTLWIPVAVDPDTGREVPVVNPHARSLAFMGSEEVVTLSTSITVEPDAARSGNEDR